MVKLLDLDAIFDETSKPVERSAVTRAPSKGPHGPGVNRRDEVSPATGRSEPDLVELRARTRAPADKAVTCGRCHCDIYIDVPIHDGQSIRRNCVRCGWLIDFPLWYGEAGGNPV